MSGGDPRPTPVNDPAGHLRSYIERMGPGDEDPGEGDPAP